ncbi:TlyA family RNA methyltransferase [Alsobacter sp. R-9]
MNGKRADVALVERGLFESRAKAQEAIAAGLVLADGRPVTKPSALIADNASVVAQPPHPWVSRGGVKLAAALDRFGIDPAGRACLDVGGSTGGFTHVLLTRGASTVTAVDVGRDQMHPSLRGHPRLRLMEQTDARSLSPATVGTPPDVITFDVSFIPLQPVLAHVLPLAAPAAVMVALVKPQFEVGRQHLKKGIVRDAAVREEACAGVSRIVETLGWTVDGLMPSPIEGGDGNQEFLLAAHKGSLGPGTASS